MKSETSRNKKRKINIFVLFFALGIISIGVFFTFYNKIYNLTIEKNMQRIEEQSNNVITILENEIHNYERMLSQAEKFIIKEDELYSKEILEALEDIMLNTGFDEIGILDSFGKMVTSENEHKNFVYEPYFKQLKKDDQNKYIYKNGVYISNVFEDRDDIEKNIMIIVPIELNNKYDYCIYGKMNISHLINNFKHPKESERYFQIIDNKGTYIYSSDNEHSFSDAKNNIWEELEQYNYAKKKNNKDIIYQNIKEGKKGSFYIEHNGEGRYVSYKPIGINNWYIFSSQTEEELDYYVTEIWSEIIKLILYTLIILAILLVLILGYIKKSRQTIKNKDERISIQNSIFKLVASKADSMPFEIDLGKKEVSFYLKDDRNLKKYSLDDITPANFINKNIISEDEYNDYKLIYKKIINGEEIKSELVHINIEEDSYWIKVNTTIIKKNNGNKHIVGILEDYNDEMDKEEKIKKHLKELNIMDMKSKTDYLTSIYNREGFIQEVNYYLSLDIVDHMRDAFLILDLDNFKEINDLLGHTVGDDVLKDTANILRKNLSKKDIVGRLGGDEFVAYIRNIEKIEDLKSIANRLNNVLYREVEKNDKKVLTTVSIGIVVVGKDDKKFEGLYEKADMALYLTKKNNKNGYSIYNKYEKGII